MHPDFGNYVVSQFTTLPSTYFLFSVPGAGNDYTLSEPIAFSHLCQRANVTPALYGYRVRTERYVTRIRKDSVFHTKFVCTSLDYTSR